MDLDLAKLLIATLGPTGLGIVVFVIFVQLSSKADQHVSSEAREAFATALLSLERVRVTGHWPFAFVATFDRVFGDRHWSLRCLGNSMIASAVGLALVSVYFVASYPEAWRILRHDLKFYTFSFVVIFAVANLLGDYLSLLETRYVLGRMREMRALQFPLFVILDLALTVLIFCLGVETSWALNVWYADNPTAPHASAILSDLQALFAGSYDPWARIDTLMYFFTALFTSVWIWLFACAWLMMKTLSVAQPGARFLLWLLPVRDRPLASVGKVVAVIAGVVAGATLDVETVLERLERVSLVALALVG